jgi:hypothetical protein
MSERDNGLPIENFIQALTSQLDRAQDAMALKARAGRPLTFAVRDLALDLRAHVDMVNSVVRIRPAGPGDTEASTLRLSLTSITRPTIEENTQQLSATEGDASIKEVFGDDISEEEQRRLEWAGIQTVKQLKEVQKRTGEHAIERVAQLPAMRLRAALQRAAQPAIKGIQPEPGTNGHSGRTPLLRIRGRNLADEGKTEVTIGGERVEVLEAKENELLLAPLAHQMSGTLEIRTAPDQSGSAEFHIVMPEATSGGAS